MKTSKPRKPASFEPEQRLITLIAILLGSKQPLTLDEIRERTDGSYGPLLDPGKQDPQGQKAYESGRRKFIRDRENLAKMGIPISCVKKCVGHKECDSYYLDPNNLRMPEVNLTFKELGILRQAAAMVNNIEAFPLSQDLMLGFAKLDAAIAGVGLQASKDYGELTTFHFQHGLIAQNPETQKNLAALFDAQMYRIPVTFSYRSSRQSDFKERKVDPYSLFLKRRVWYLVGFCHLRKEVRMFDVNRVFAVKQTGPRNGFQIPDDFEVAPWRTLEPWDIASHDAVVTRIRLERPVASLSSFSNATVIAKEEDGSVLIELTVRNNEALFGFIMSLWGRAVILSPPESVQAFNDLVRRIALVHGFQENK